MWSRLSLDHLLLIAEEVLGVPFDELQQTVCASTAEAALTAPFPGPGEVDLYPDPVVRAAICCSWIIRDRPFPVGNKRVGYECMLEMLARGGYPWPRPSEDAEEIVVTLKRLEAGAIGEAEFVRWVRSRVALGERLRKRPEGYGLGGTWGSPSP
jgi:prophage maintenance system killer protein